MQSINAEPTEANINALDQRGRGAQSEGQRRSGRGREGEGGGSGEVENSENVRPSTEENTGHETPSSPLFIATSNVVEIAQELLDKFPRVLSLFIKWGNILHLAVMHRQRMSSTIDHNGYTLLHQVAQHEALSRRNQALPSTRATGRNKMVQGEVATLVQL